MFEGRWKLLWPCPCLRIVVNGSIDQFGGMFKSGSCDCLNACWLSLPPSNLQPLPSLPFSIQRCNEALRLNRDSDVSITGEFLSRTRAIRGNPANVAIHQDPKENERIDSWMLRKRTTWQQQAKKTTFVFLASLL